VASLLEQDEDDDRQEEAEMMRQRGPCINELDITASAVDVHW